MGLVTLPGTSLQYFSLSEEVSVIVSKFMEFILTLSPAWILFVFAITICFVAAGVFLRVKRELRGIAR